MPPWIAVILLGIIEGITEFLPVSSTGHLLLAEQWLPRQSDFFNVVIQSGAILAILVLFRHKVKRMIVCRADKKVRQYWLKLAFAFAMTVAGVLIAKKAGAKLPETPSPVAWATLIGGVLFLAVEMQARKKPQTEEVSWPTAAAIGAAQVLAAIFPGASRSGATILAALICSVTRPAATEFSFLLGIPTLLAAGVYEGYQAIQGETIDPSAWEMILLGFSVSALMAFLVARWLLRYVQSHNFIGFAWYRIALGALILLWAWNR